MEPVVQQDALMGADAAAGAADLRIVRVCARCRRNRTGILLEKGARYSFTAAGDWHDAALCIGPEGYPSDCEKIHPLLRWLFRLVERWRVCPEANWFALVGIVGEQGRLFCIGGQQAQWTAPATGELICLTNDLPWMYWNNHGAVQLRVTPLQDPETP